jgi:hypothetical protein
MGLSPDRLCYIRLSSGLVRSAYRQASRSFPLKLDNFLTSVVLPRSGCRVKPLGVLTMCNLEARKRLVGEKRGRPLPMPQYIQLRPFRHCSFCCPAFPFLDEARSIPLRALRAILQFLSNRSSLTPAKAAPFSFDVRLRLSARTLLDAWKANDC